MPSTDFAYFRSRVIVERGLALSAVEPRIAAIHERFARSYEALIKAEELRLATPETNSGMHQSRPSTYWLGAVDYAFRQGPIAPGH
jgi:hypothetical protein